jgi:hypothetical protein
MKDDMPSSYNDDPKNRFLGESDPLPTNMHFCYIILFWRLSMKTTCHLSFYDYLKILFLLKKKGVIITFPPPPPVLALCILPRYSRSVRSLLHSWSHPKYACLVVCMKNKVNVKNIFTQSSQFSPFVTRQIILGSNVGSVVEKGCNIHCLHTGALTIFICNWMW